MSTHPEQAQVPFRPETWPVDADGFAPDLCTICGTPVRYGSRHAQCAFPERFAPQEPAERHAFNASWDRLSPDSQEAVRKYFGLQPDTRNRTSPEAAEPVPAPVQPADHHLVDPTERSDQSVQRAAGVGAVQPVAWLPPEIAAIAERLHTQDNRITQDPLFAVQQKRRIYGVDHDYCDNAEWVVDGETWTPEDGEAPPDGARRVGFIDKWEFVTGCLTEQGCKDFIACNGHNLHEPRIYAYGSYRNAEWIALRKWLMSLRPAAGDREKQP